MSYVKGMDRIEQKELDTIDIKELTKFQKKQVISLVEQFNEDNKETTKDSFHVCPKCGKYHPNITKAGKTKGGKQMYLCHECGRRFVEDIGKPSYYSWYDISAWRIFIEDTLQGKTLDESAEKLGIFHSTAWSWRHKIMDKLRSSQCFLSTINQQSYHENSATLPKDPKSIFYPPSDGSLVKV